MKNAIILHGTPNQDEYYSSQYPSASNSHWIPWLQKELLIRDIVAVTPEVPYSFKPEYQIWKQEVERYPIGADTILVGHSCGAGFFVRWLSENPVPIKQLVLVAPWLDPDREKTTDFFEFSIDQGIAQRVGEIHLFVSADDDQDVQVSTEQILEALPQIQVHRFTDKGHFCYEDMGTTAFPELVEVITAESF